MSSAKSKLVCMLFSDKGRDLGLLLLRLCAGLMIMTHGIAKISHFSELSTTFPNPIGLGSKLSLILMILAEAGASSFVILGFLTRLAAIVLVIGMSVAAFIVPTSFSISAAESALLYLVIFTTLLITGAGKYSVDGIIKSRLCRKNA